MAPKVTVGPEFAEEGEIHETLLPSYRLLVRILAGSKVAAKSHLFAYLEPFP